MSAAVDKHTPGPWRLFSKNGIVAVMRRNKEVIKWTGFDASDFPKAAESNARLIAAAPEMLKLLKMFVAGEEAQRGCTCKWCKAIRLIAKSTGPAQ